MVGPLLELASIHHPIPMTENNTSFASRLDTLLTDIKYEVGHSQNLLHALLVSDTNASREINQFRISCLSSHTSTVNIDSVTPETQKKKLEEFIPQLQSRRRDIEATFRIHTTSGINKLHAAGQIILREVQERHRRMSWGYMKDRRDLRRAYVPLQARLLQISDTIKSGRSRNIYREGVDQLNLDMLSREISPVDSRFWGSLAWLERRKIITHRYVHSSHIRIFVYNVVHVLPPAVKHAKDVLSLPSLEPVIYVSFVMVGGARIQF